MSHEGVRQSRRGGVLESLLSPVGPLAVNARNDYRLQCYHCRAFLVGISVISTHAHARRQSRESDSYNMLSVRP